LRRGWHPCLYNPQTRFYRLQEFVSLLQGLLLCLGSGLGVRRIWQLPLHSEREIG
jgi:hypothetical protein